MVLQLLISNWFHDFSFSRSYYGELMGILLIGLLALGVWAWEN